MMRLTPCLKTYDPTVKFIFIGPKAIQLHLK